MSARVCESARMTDTAIVRLLVSKRDAAQALSLSIRTIDHLISRGELASRKVGRRTLVLASSLVAFARKESVAASARGE